MAVQLYRNDPAAKLLTALIDHDTVGVVGYTVRGREVTLLQIATAPTCSAAREWAADSSRKYGDAYEPSCRLSPSPTKNAAIFYAPNDLAITSLGENYYGVERFRVRSDARAEIWPAPEHLTFNSIGGL